MTEPYAQTTLIGMTAAFIAWSLYFLALYGFLSIACAARLDGTAIVAALAALSAAAFGVIARLGWRAARARRAASAAGDVDAGRREFMARAAARCAGLALLAALWVAAPILLLAPCG